MRDRIQPREWKAATLGAAVVFVLAGMLVGAGLGTGMALGGLVLFFMFLGG